MWYVEYEAEKKSILNIDGHGYFKLRLASLIMLRTQPDVGKPRSEGEGASSTYLMC